MGRREELVSCSILDLDGAIEPRAGAAGDLSSPLFGSWARLWCSGGLRRPEPQFVTGVFAIVCSAAVANGCLKGFVVH